MSKISQVINKRFLAIIIIVALILFFVLYTNFTKDNNPINMSYTGLVGDISIGTLLPLTGDLSSQGEGDKAAIDMAASDFNDYLEKNNITDWRLKMVHEDSGTNPVMALEKLMSLYAKNIHLVVGPASSGELRNIMGYSNANGMLLFSQSSTAPSLAISNDNVYRLTPDDSKQGPAIASLLQYNGITTVIQLVRADTWGDGLSKSIEKSFINNSDNISQIIRYNPESPEFSVTTSLLAKIVEEQAAIYGTEKVGVMIIGFAETLQFMQSATEHDILDDVLWFGSDGSTNDVEIISDPLASKFANKVQFRTTLLSVNDNDIREDVQERLVAKLGKTPKSYTLSAYDIVWILGLSVLEADSSNVDDITPVISNVAAKYNGAIGNTKLNNAGDLDTSNYDVWGINEGSWRIIGHYYSDTDSILEISSIVEHDIKNAVSQTIIQYDGNLDSITNLQFGEYYTFVLDGNLDTILVHPNDVVVGTHPTGVNHANISVQEILEILHTTDGVWIDYVYENPATNNKENKRSWLTLHDGYVFASGYYNPN